MPLSDRVEQLNREIGSTFERVFSDLRREISERVRAGHDEVLRRLDELSPEPPGRFLSHEEFTPHLHEAGSAARRDAFDELRAATAALDQARSQAEILASLLEQSGRFASRAALLLLRGGEFRGWGGHGFGDAEAALRGLSLEAAQGGPWERLASGAGPERLTPADCAALCSRIESPLPSGGLLIPLVLRDRVAAALYADALDGVSLEPAPLQLLAYTAALAIETLPFRERPATRTLDPVEGETDTAAASAGGLSAEPVNAPAPAAEEPATVERVERVERAETAERTEAVEPAGTVGMEPEVEAEPVATSPAATSAIEQDFSSAAPVYAEEAAAPWAAAEPPPVEETVEIEAQAEPEVEAEPEIEAEPEPEPAPAWGDGSAWATPAEEPATLQTAQPTQAVAFQEPEPGFPTQTAELPRVDTFQPQPAPAAYEAQPQETVLLPRAGLRDSGVTEAPREPAPVTPIRPVAPPPREADDTAAAMAAAGTSEVRPPSDVQGPGWAFATTRVPVAPNDESLHEEARRLARLLVSEIKLYNEEQVEEGRRNRDVYERLKEDIDRSRQMYEERVEPRILKSTDYFYQELVRILAAGDARALGI